MALLAGAVVVLSSCSADPPPAPSPAPSPTGVVVQVLNPSDLVLVDGRRLHVARMNGSDPADPCDQAADQALAERLVAGGRTLLLRQAETRDVPSDVPPGFLQADVRTPDARDYADTFIDQQPYARQEACPTPTPTSTPSATPEPSDGSDVEVDVDSDDDDSRFCSRRWYC